MPEDMSRDPLIGKLARFTPRSSSLDRDAMLFAAGKASARKGRGWQVATMALAVTQAVTLSVWLAVPRSDAVVRLTGGNTEQQMAVPESAPSSPAESAPAGSYGNLVRRWERDELPPPAPVADPVPMRPVLSVAASRAMLGNDY